MRGRQLLTAALSAALATGTTIALAAAPSQAAQPGSWSLTPANSDPDNRTIVETADSWSLSGRLDRQSAERTTGTLTFPAKTLDSAVNRISAQVEADRKSTRLDSSHVK